MPSSIYLTDKSLVIFKDLDSVSGNMVVREVHPRQVVKIEYQEHQPSKSTQFESDLITPSQRYTDNGITFDPVQNSRLLITNCITGNVIIELDYYIENSHKCFPYIKRDGSIKSIWDSLEGSL